MRDRPPLVLAVHEPPIGPTQGSPIRSNRLLTGLAEAFEVTLVTYVPADGSLTADDVRAALPVAGVVAVPMPVRSKRLSQAASLASPRSWQWGRFARPVFARALRHAAARTEARIVQFEDLGVAGNGPVPGTLSVFGPHNVEHRILRAAAEARDGMRSAFAALEWPKTRREEVRAWRSMQLCLAVSDVDAQAMREGGAARVVTVPNGTDPVDRLPPPRRAPGEPLRVLFVGTASYQPYERGIAWFVREVLPRVRAQVDATFDVVGDPPLRPVDAPGVAYRGRVPSLEPFYAAAHVAVVPVFEGSGTRLKILEALALGRPVVSTALGAEGLPVRAGEDYARAEEPGAFARALVDTAEAMDEDPAGLDRRLAAGYELARRFFWPSIVADLVDLYRRELGGPPAGSAPARSPAWPRSARPSRT